MRNIVFIIFVLMLCVPVLALPEWIQVNGTKTTLVTNCENTFIFNNGLGNGHISDIFHNGSLYGGMPGQPHNIRGYTYYEAYYVDPDGQARTSCLHYSANEKSIVYADDNVAVIECGCIGSTHVEKWRYIIPRDQCGMYETESKELKRYYESQNNQQVQFLNTSLMTMKFSSRSGSITTGNWYLPLFSQFSKTNTPFEWMNGYDKTNNISLAWIHTGADNLGRSIDRRYPSSAGLTEQQVDFLGAGEGTRTEMPLGMTWLETWKGIVPGNSTDVRAKALALVGHKTEENKTQFLSVTRSGQNMNVNTGALVYQHQPYLNYDFPYGSGNRMLTEYPFVNTIKAHTGSNLTGGEDYWNSTYRNPDESFGWTKYTIGDNSTGLFVIRNERRAYLDADGLIWTYNVTAIKPGNMTFSIEYGSLTIFSQVFDKNKFSVKTVDPIEGEYGLTFIFPENFNVTKSRLTTTVTFPTRYMSAGETVSYKTYVIPHKWSTQVSIDTFHSREKTKIVIPYRVLIPGIEWMPTKSVTAYSAYDTGNNYIIETYSEAGKHPIQMYSNKMISSLSVNVGSIEYAQKSDGTIFAEWDVPSATIGEITLTYLANGNGPSVDFIANITEGYPPLTVSFNDTSTKNPISWQWDVTNDGVFDYGQQNVTHTYTDVIGNTVKTFGVKLNVTNAFGSNFKIKQNYIKLYPLNVSFTAKTDNASAPFKVQFNDTTTNGTPTIWNWSFGDGSFSESQNPVHVYNSAGLYNITLNASNPSSFGVSSQGKLLTGSNLPKANFTSNLTSGISPFTVQFNDTSTGNPTAFNWSFGDMVYSTEKNPVHTYTNAIARNYDVELNVTNASGSDRVVKTGYIHIDPPPAIPLPKANFTSNLSSGISPLTIQFNDTSTGNPVSWYWMFGDAKSSTDKNPVHKYTSTVSRNYYVSLTVTNSKGSSRIIKNNYIHVDPIPLPKANFTSNVTAGISPLTIQFNDTSTGDPISWEWNFGDAKFSSVKNPVHTYTSTYAKNYTVTLNVTNIYGNNREKSIKTNYIQIRPASE